MAGHLSFRAHETVDLPADPTWREDPFHDANWRFRYHALAWLYPLLLEGRAGDRQALARAATLLQDWVRDNPPQAPASPSSWGEHATGVRSIVLACALELLPHEAWLLRAADEHARTLVRIYNAHGNHSLDQTIGLLTLGCVRERRDWVDLAARRITSLGLESIDAEGVTNEQSINYQYYNYRQYGEAFGRLRACGREPDAALVARWQRMPELLAHATLPNGEYETIGDTERRRAEPIPGTPAEFAATLGAAGPAPASPWAVYRAGYAFGRSGWGTGGRAFSDETFYSLRFGPGRAFHGHDDKGSLTLYGYGTRLLIDPGVFRYDDPRQGWMTSADAHNVVTVDGRRAVRGPAAALAWQQHAAAFDAYEVRHRAFAGVEARRRVLFAREAGFLVVEDVLDASRPATFRQRWHLVEDAAPVLSRDRVETRRGRPNLSMVWVGSGPPHGVVGGGARPVGGWLSPSYNRLIPAPELEATLRGRSVRFLVVLVPSEARARVRVARLPTSRDAVRVLVEIDGRRWEAWMAPQAGGVGIRAA
jgi:hypothetical protein